MTEPRTFPPDTKFAILERLPETPWSVTQIIGPFNSEFEAGKYAARLWADQIGRVGGLKYTVHPVNYAYNPPTPPNSKKESPHVPPKKLS